MEQASTQNTNAEEFSSLLEQFDYQSPQVGQIVEGTIIQIDQEGVVLDIGVKRDAFVSARDLSQLDQKIIASLVIGDKVTVEVTQAGSGDKELQVSLSKGLERQSWRLAEDLKQSDKPLELEVTSFNRGGLIVKFETLRGFIPFSLVPELQGIRSPRQAEKVKRDMVGKPIQVKVVEVDPERNRLVFSASAAQEEKIKMRLQQLSRNQILRGRVTSIADFGVFVDLDGIEGLVHISQLDWKQVRRPGDVVKVGDEIEVKVTGIDIEKQRVSLSRKSVLPSPWETVAQEIKAGDYVEGRITRVVDFGAFVKLPIGLEGLIHKSQIGYGSTQNPHEAVKPGETVLLKVLEVSPERKRLALSMRQVPVERQIAWAMEKATSTHPSIERSRTEEKEPVLPAHDQGQASPAKGVSIEEANAQIQTGDFAQELTNATHANEEVNSSITIDGEEVTSDTRPD